ncbi:glycoside hydrolase family 28 protein [Clostridium sp. Marseille-P299]|uniref:glycoside hydrolase family 28 protein n=1 Tax=Clostridium sp. Marseille-P299 TaxID=1805477 RepID=UPI00083758AB|nr:glycoside hydrolase family 28 protein [Clostridium sp. Marseille-P299]
MQTFTVELPVFPDRKVSIVDYNAVPGGTVSNTVAINKAIQELYSLGGGTVIVPKGIWLTGPITLKSNINLHLEKGAFIKFDKNPEEYPIILTDYEGQPRLRAVSPIHAFDEENIAITGYGVIDGNGHEWRPLKKFKITNKQWEARLKKSQYFIETDEGGIWYPSKTSYEGCLVGEPSLDDPDAIAKATPYYDHYRPVMTNLVRCNKILIEGVTLQNSPAWNLHPLLCTNLTLRNAFIRNDSFAQNGDGLDLESCRFVDIYDVKFDVGDDAICMKSGKNAIARKITVPTEHVRIRDCVVYHGHGGFVVGSEMSRGVRDVVIENCLFIGTDTGIRFKSAIGRGGVVEDIMIKDIQMTDIAAEAVIFTMGYVLFRLDHEASDQPDEILKEDIPEFKNITIRDVNCVRAGQAIKIEGLEQLPIHDLTLENVVIEAKKGIEIKNANQIFLKNVTVTNQDNKEQSFHFENDVLAESSYNF